MVGALELSEVEEELEKSAKMTAKPESYGGCKILSVGGRIDFESALDFEHHINTMIRDPSDYYIIELSQVELLSSAGLRVMLSTAKRVAQRNASLALAAPSSVVRQVFEISHFNLLFKIFASVPEAIAALKGSAAQPEEGVHRAEVRDIPARQEGNTSEPLPPVTGRRNEEVPASEPPGDLEPRAEAQTIESLVQTKPPMVANQEPSSNVVPPPLPVSRSPVAVYAAEAPTVAPPLSPPGENPAIDGPKKVRAEAPARETQPPPLPPRQSIPVPPATRAAGPVARREANYPARLEVRAEGTSYPCKDGDVIGTEGKLAQPFFSKVTNLAPRHLLIGQVDGRWFVFTPQNVQHPFSLDGVILRAGERKTLQYVEHQIEFSGHVFGFRLMPEQVKVGFLSRVFGGKRKS
jgi:anti-sigma B factor antagonist